MAPEEISSESDVTPSSDTSVADSSGSSEQSTQEASQQDAGSTESTDNLPFNDPKSPMHSRFKELHEQAQSAKAELERERQERAAWQTQLQQQFEQRMQQIQQQIPKQEATKPHQQLLEQLKQANPEFAQLFEKTLEASQQIPTLNQQLETMRMERDRAAVNSKLGELYSQYKIPERIRPQYERAIKNIAYENPKIGLKDADQVFKQVHEELSKFYDEYDREKLKGYVKDKKSDATPSTKTGGVPPASGSKQPGKVVSREEYRAQARSMLAQALRDGNKKI